MFMIFQAIFVFSHRILKDLVVYCPNHLIIHIMQKGQTTVSG